MAGESGGAAAGKRRMGCGRMALYGLGGLVALVVLGKAIGPQHAPPAPAGAPAISATSSTSAPAPVLTVREISKAFAANEVAATARFAGPLQARGSITKIGLDVVSDPFVMLDAGPYAQVQAVLGKDDAERAKALSKGDSVTVSCAKAAMFLSMPILSDCRLTR